jgi:DNA polymerase-3 subunit epsilon
MTKIVTPSARAAAAALAQAALTGRPLYLDTETTGLGAHDEIIEICLLEADGSVLLTSLVRPQHTIPADVVRIHRITNAMVADAPTWAELWPQVAEQIEGRRLAIYNADFDLRMMRQSHARYGLPWARHERQSLCIMKLYAQFRGDWNQAYRSYRWHSLENAGRQCGIALPNSHRAADDALLARAVLHAIAGQGPVESSGAPDMFGEF